MSEDLKPPQGRGLWINYLIATGGWLACAAFCLVLAIKLEEFPQAYEVLFPAVLLLLFGNIFVFLFITSRFGRDTQHLSIAVSRVCIGETLLLLGLYCLGRFGIGL